MRTQILELHTGGSESITDITRECSDLVAGAGDGLLNVFDFLAFQTAFSEEDPAADLAAPFGVFNVFDFLAFQTAFGMGC